MLIELITGASPQSSVLGGFAIVSGSHLPFDVVSFRGISKKQRIAGVLERPGQRPAAHGTGVIVVQTKGDETIAGVVRFGDNFDLVV